MQVSSVSGTSSSVGNGARTLWKRITSSPVVRLTSMDWPVKTALTTTGSSPRVIALTTEVTVKASITTATTTKVIITGVVRRLLRRVDDFGITFLATYRTYVDTSRQLTQTDSTVDVNSDL